MSKKGNDSSTSARIRENQRRSRNRRKELIEDLQQRVRDYELKGIEATQDMQRAARRVAHENLGLRTMLAQRGVTQAEMDAFLQAFNNGEVDSATQSVNPSTSVPVPIPVPVPVPVQCATPETTASPGVGATQTDTRCDGPSMSRNNCCSRPSQDQLNHPPAGAQEMEIEWEEPPQSACGPTQARCRSGSGGCKDPRDELENHNIEPNHATTEAPDCPSTSDCFCPPTTTLGVPTNSGLEISCETAAAIIIEMHGDGDIDAVRASLGCNGRESCTVRNSTVLQIMDER